MEANIIVLSRLFNKSSGVGTASDNSVFLGDKLVEIPKLTPAKYKLLFGRIETLPQVIARIAAARGDGTLISTALIGIDIALDEIVDVISVLADIDADYIRENAGIDEITTFIVRTLERNDLAATLKNFRAVLSAINPTRPRTAVADGN